MKPSPEMKPEGCQLSPRSERTLASNLRLKDLNPFLSCPLCSGYLVDATTVVECMHSFCRSCILQYLENQRNCPCCDREIENNPNSIRSDQKLQDMVYKIVPGLYTNELKQRKEFYVQHCLNDKEKDKAVSQEKNLQMRQLKELSRIIFTPDEMISLSMEECEYQEKTKSAKKSVVEPQEKRYFRCPAAVSMKTLKRLLRCKLGLSVSHEIEMFYGIEPLLDTDTLMDVAYMFSWKRITPLRLFFKVFLPDKSESEIDPVQTILDDGMPKLTREVDEQTASSSQPETVISAPKLEVFPSDSIEPFKFSGPGSDRSSSPDKDLVVDAILNDSLTRFNERLDRLTVTVSLDEPVLIKPDPEQQKPKIRVQSPPLSKSDLLTMDVAKPVVSQAISHPSAPKTMSVSSCVSPSRRQDEFKTPKMVVSAPITVPPVLIPSDMTRKVAKTKNGGSPEGQPPSKSPKLHLPNGTSKKPSKPRAPKQPKFVPPLTSTGLVTNGDFVKYSFPPLSVPNTVPQFEFAPNRPPPALMQPYFLLLNHAATAHKKSAKPAFKPIAPAPPTLTPSPGLVISNRPKISQQSFTFLTSPAVTEPKPSVLPPIPISRSTATTVSTTASATVRTASAVGCSTVNDATLGHASRPDSGVPIQQLTPQTTSAGNLVQRPVSVASRPEEESPIHAAQILQAKMTESLKKSTGPPVPNGGTKPKKSMRGKPPALSIAPQISTKVSTPARINGHRSPVFTTPLASTTTMPAMKSPSDPKVPKMAILPGTSVVPKKPPVGNFPPISTLSRPQTLPPLAKIPPIVDKKPPAEQATFAPALSPTLKNLLAGLSTKQSQSSMTPVVPLPKSKSPLTGIKIDSPDSDSTSPPSGGSGSRKRKQLSPVKRPPNTGGQCLFPTSNFTTETSPKTEPERDTSKVESSSELKTTLSAPDVPKTQQKVCEPAPCGTNVACVRASPAGSGAAVNNNQYAGCGSTDIEKGLCEAAA